MRRFKFPPALYLCAGNCGEHDSGLNVFHPEELTYWSGRFRGYDGRFYSATRPGWYCEACRVDLLLPHTRDPEPGSNKPMKLFIANRDLGLNLETAMRETKKTARRTARDLVILLDSLAEIDKRMNVYVRGLNKRIKSMVKS